MTPDEIREAFSDEKLGHTQLEHMPLLTVGILVEIAAQLAELNKNFKDKQFSIAYYSGGEGM